MASTMKSISVNRSSHEAHPDQTKRAVNTNRVAPSCDTTFYRSAIKSYYDTVSYTNRDGIEIFKFLLVPLESFDNIKTKAELHHETHSAN